jgi:hypothetical protein
MSSLSTQLNLDTSVLFNFVYSKLPGEIEEDRGSQRLIEQSSFFCVIGPKANDEFGACCDRRRELYDDLLDWLAENPDGSIYEYDPTQRDVHTSQNDVDHIRLEIQHGWGEEPRRKQLSDLRRCEQDLEAYQESVPDRLLDRVYRDLADNRELLDALDGLGLEHDIHIVVDAVEILREDGIRTLVAVDSDITADEQIEAINEAIQDTEDEALTLDINKAGRFESTLEQITAPL